MNVLTMVYSSALILSLIIFVRLEGTYFFLSLQNLLFLQIINARFQVPSAIVDLTQFILELGKARDCKWMYTICPLLMELVMKLVMVLQ